MTSLGIDIGCISLKAALAGEADDHALYTDLLTRNPDLFQTPHEGLTVVDGRPVLVASYTRIKGSPGAATQALLDALLAVLPEGKIAGVRVTGSGGRLIGQALEASFENEFKAITRGVTALHPETQTIFEMGGETSKFIRLETGDEARCAGIADYQTNGDCAAGTGSFMDQQASRLLYDIEDVGDIVLEAGKAASIAGRCSVFAKSDMIHAQQKGYEPPEVLRGLCDAVMRNFKGTIAKGKVVQPPIAFIGGVAANRGAVQALQEAFDLEQGDLFVPEFHASLGAVGAQRRMELRHEEIALLEIEGLLQGLHGAPVGRDPADERDGRLHDLALGDRALEVAHHGVAEPAQDFGRLVPLLLGVDHVRLREHAAAAGDARRFAGVEDDVADVLDVVEEAARLLVHEG